MSFKHMSLARFIREELQQVDEEVKALTQTIEQAIEAKVVQAIDGKMILVRRKVA